MFAFLLITKYPLQYLPKTKEYLPLRRIFVPWCIIHQTRKAFKVQVSLFFLPRFQRSQVKFFVKDQDQRVMSFLSPRSPCKRMFSEHMVCNEQSASCFVSRITEISCGGSMERSQVFLTWEPW
jgi:hypothetical protein